MVDPDRRNQELQSGSLDAVSGVVDAIGTLAEVGVDVLDILVTVLGAVLEGLLAVLGAVLEGLSGL